MPQTPAQKAWRQAQRKEQGQSIVRIDTTPETKSKWQAYAQYKDLPLATLIRQHMDEAMEKDQWTYDPENKE